MSINVTVIRLIQDDQLTGSQRQGKDSAGTRATDPVEMIDDGTAQICFQRFEHLNQNQAADTTAIQTQNAPFRMCLSE